MIDRFDSMRALLAVVERGSFSAAARALRLSPSMVTKHVAAQEERLGVRLLHRTTRRLALTEAGRAYVALAERIVADVAEAESIAAADQRNLHGLVRVNGPVSFGVRHIAPRLPSFHAAYPDIVIELGLNDRLIDLTEEGWDMAIRIGRMSSSPLIARKLADNRMMLCASPGYLAAHGTPATVAALRDHACLGYTLSRVVGPDEWAFGRTGDVLVPVRGPVRSSNGDALLAAAEAGLGLTYQPSFMLMDAVNAGRLVVLTLDHPPIEMGGVYAVYAPGRQLPARSRVFIDYLAAAFAGGAPWDTSLD